MTKNIYTTSKETIAKGSTWKGESVTFPIPEGAELVFVKDCTYCTKANKRVGAYALKNPEKYYPYADNNYYYTVPDDAISGKLADAELVRAAIKEKSDNWQETADQWRVNINGQKFDYYTGIGHRKEGRPQKPELDAVLYALVWDASASEESFDDWCAGLGYDTDSRKALETYLQCQETVTKLRKAGINIPAERERLADY